MKCPWESLCEPAEPQTPWKSRSSGLTARNLSWFRTSARSKAPRASWWTFKIFVPALALLAIAAFGGYEAGQRRAAPAPQAVAEFPLYAAARGEEPVLAPPSGAKFYTLYMDKTWDRDYPAYRASFITGGAEKFSVLLAAPAPGQSIHILIPAAALPSGRYTLIVSAGGEEVARYPFTLRIE